MGISLALGPVVGGALVDSVSWRAIFLVNLPVGLAAIVLTSLYVPESRAPHARRPDPLGQVLVILALASVTSAIIEGPSSGWLSTPIVALFALFAASAGVLVRHELRRREPLIEMRFFASVPFSGASVTAVCAFAALGGFLFLNTLYLQDARGLSPLRAGLYTLPLAGMTLVFGPLSGRLVARYGARPSLLVAGVTMTAGSLLLTGVSATTPMAHLILAYLLFGLGFGLVNPPITNTAVSGMPADQAGVAAAVASTSRQVGQTLGVAIAGAAAGSGALAAAGRGFARASHAGWWIVSGLAFAVLVVSALTTTRRAQESARRTAAALGETAVAQPSG